MFSVGVGVGSWSRFFFNCWSRSRVFKNAGVGVGFLKLSESGFQNCRSRVFKTAGVGFSKLLESGFQNCWSRNPKKSSDSTTLHRYRC